MTKTKIIPGLLILVLAAVCLLIFMCPILETVQGVNDYGNLWTTDAAGLAEINEFQVGDAVFLMVPSSSNIQAGTYTVYLFGGNLVPNVGDLIPDDFGTPVVPPFNISTDGNGRFGPTQVWSSATVGEYTIILDQVLAGTSGAINIGSWAVSQDYRDDLAGVPPPSLFVVPEVPAGILATTAAFFCGVGLFAAPRMWRTSHKRFD
jgi:hypothetical protein